MNDIKAQAIRKAYIEPIRSVMLVDERFPNYSDLQNALQAMQNHRVASHFGATPVPEPLGLVDSRHAALALELWNACREWGWVCDVENKHFEIKPLTKADLIVLDYLLDDQSPDAAHQLLAQLADADRSRLVILYTNAENLSDVRRKVAGYLRGADAQPPFAELVEAIGGVDDTDELADDLDKLKEHVDEEVIDTYLLDDVSGACEKLTPRIPREFRGHARKLSQYLCESVLIDRGAPGPRSGRDIEFGQQESVWLVCKNLFVACVSKEQQSGAVFDALIDALKDWDPTPLHLSLAYARAVISRKGFEVERAVPGRSALEVGLTYLTLTEGSKRGTRALFEKIWEALGYRVIGELANFGNELIQGDGSDDSLDQAKRLCRSSDIDHVEIFGRLNVFLCSQEHPELYLRTGTILGKPGDEEVWICVTPLCELDPRPAQTNSWNQKLAPFRAVTLRRAKVVRVEERILKDVTDLSHVFWESEQGVMCASVSSIRMETMLVEADGRLSQGIVKMRRVCLGSDGTLGLQEHSMQVLGQLRDQNASLLLQQAGTHSSRIGVDFVEPPKKKPKGQDGKGGEKTKKK